MPGSRFAIKGRQLFDALLENVPVGLIVASAPNLTVIAISEMASRQFGKPRHAFEGHPVSSVVTPYRLLRGDGKVCGLEDLPISRACQFGESVRDEQWTVEEPNGRRITLLVNAGPIRTRRGKIVAGLASWSDITASKTTEAELRAALETGRTLLREANHRIKNHLEMVASLVRIESTKIGVESAQLAKTIEDKLAVLAAAQQDFYTLEHGKRASARHLLEGVIRALESEQHPIRSFADEDIELENEQATAIALVINEGVSNCLKHAFPEGHPGSIEVSLRRAGSDMLALVVADAGVGLSAEPRNGALGLTIIDILSRQLGGQFSITGRPEGGTRLSVRFPARPASPK